MWNAASLLQAVRLPEYGGGLSSFGTAGGGGEEPVAASPGPAAAAEVTAAGGAVDQWSGARAEGAWTRVSCGKLRRDPGSRGLGED